MAHQDQPTSEAISLEFSQKEQYQPQGIPRYRDKRVECGEREREAEGELEGNKAEVTAALTFFL